MKSRSCHLKCINCNITIQGKYIFIYRFLFHSFLFLFLLAIIVSDFNQQGLMNEAENDFNSSPAVGQYRINVEST